MNCVLILIGASFRLGGQGNTSIGNPLSYNEQKEACMSHINFCKHLHLRPTIVIDTYSSPYVDELISWYSDYKVVSRIHDTLIGYDGIINDSILIAKQYIDEAEFAFFIRIDLLLKLPLFKINMLTEKLLFSSICFTLNNYHMYMGLPRVADLMLFIPKRLLYLLTNNTLLLSHESYAYFVHIGLKHEDIGFMLDTFHDSDSAKDWNPLYKIVNHPETTIWYDSGKKISDIFCL